MRNIHARPFDRSSHDRADSRFYRFVTFGALAFPAKCCSPPLAASPDFFAAGHTPIFCPLSPASRHRLPPSAPPPFHYQRMLLVRLIAVAATLLLLLWGGGMVKRSRRRHGGGGGGAGGSGARGRGARGGGGDGDGGGGDGGGGDGGGGGHVGGHASVEGFVGVEESPERQTPCPPPSKAQSDAHDTNPHSSRRCALAASSARRCSHAQYPPTPVPYPPLPPSESGESAASDAVQRLGEYQEELRRQRRALREARDLARPVQLLQHMRRGERIAEVNTLFCLSLNVAPPLLPYVQSLIQKNKNPKNHLCPL